MRRIARLDAALCAIALTIAAAIPARAQIPDRPIRIVVPNAAGGGADLLARVIALRLAERTKGQVVVENRTGAGTVVGTRSVVTAEPDGTTLLIAQTSLPISASINPNVGYDPRRDLTPIANVALGPNGLFIHPSVPAKDLKEFIAYAKASPGKLSYSSPGVGTASHMGMELLKSSADLDIVHVPNRGTGPALIDLIGGQVTMMLGSLPSTLPEVRSGRVRLIAVAEKERAPWAPEIATVEEQGIAGFESGNWTGLLGPANMDPKVVAALNEHVVAIVNTPEMKDWLFKAGFAPIASTPKDFADRIANDMTRWSETAKRANILVK